MSVKEKLAEVELLLDEYENKSGLPKIKNVEECECLSWTLDDLKHKANEELDEATYILSQFGFNLQRLINHKLTRVNWADSNLKIVFGQEAQNYNLYSYEGSKNAVIANNEYAFALHDLRTKSQMVVDRLSYLPAKVEFMTKQIVNVLRNRRENSYAARI